MKTVRSAIKQAIFSRDFVIGLIGVIAVVFLSSFSDIFETLRTEGSLPHAFHNRFIANAIVSDAMTLALPVIAALPFTASLVNDMKSGFIRSYLHRTSRKNYLAGKCAACGLSGGSVLALGILVSDILSAAAFIPLEDPVSKEAAATLFYADLVKRIVLIFLSGAFWSLCGLTLAALTGSKYMAYASPFIIYYLLIILHERYFDKIYVLYPKEWIGPSARWMLGDWGVILLLLGLIAAAGAAFFFAAGRRISQL
jgi:hypothetical protein